MEKSLSSWKERKEERPREGTSTSAIYLLQVRDNGESGRRGRRDVIVCKSSK